MSFVSGSFAAQLQHDFDEMLRTENLGQNTPCSIIPDWKWDGGFGAGSDETRCVCYSKNGDGNYIMHFSLRNHPRRGDIVFANTADQFFLLENEPQLQPNCHTVTPTACNHLLTIFGFTPAKTDERGMLMQEAQRVDYIRQMPAVVRSNVYGIYLQNTPGEFMADKLKVTMQANEYTQNIPIEARFILDGQTYAVMDKQASMTADQKHGIVMLTCERLAGNAV